MARPIKTGLDYFPLDTNFYRNRKIRRLLHAQGSNALAVWVVVMAMIYEDEGYYIVFDENTCFDIAEVVGVTEGAVKEIVLQALKITLFDNYMYTNFNILTSESIQAQYLEIINSSKRKNEIAKEYKLPREETWVNSEETTKNKELSTQIKEKKNKVNKNKQNQNKEREIFVEDLPFCQKLEDEDPDLRHNFRKLWDIYPKKNDFEGAFVYYAISMRNGATNKQIQTGIVNYIKFLKKNGTDFKFVKMDVNFFKTEHWKNHQQEVPDKFVKEEPIPEFMKSKEVVHDDLANQVSIEEQEAIKNQIKELLKK